MQGRRCIKGIALAGVLGMVVPLLAACAGGVPQSEYDAVKQQLAAKQQEAANLQQQLQARGTGQGAGPTAEALRQQLAAKEKELADKALVTTLIGARAQPTATPRPAATPVPPGFVAPTPAPRPSYLFEVAPFAFYVETLSSTTSSRYGVASTVSCAINSVFKRGMLLVWRFEVFDTSTGKRVTELDGATVKLVLPHGEEVPTRFSARGGTGPWTWVSAWHIPLDYPLGAFDYSIGVTSKDGSRTGTFKVPALVRAGTATATAIDSRVQIVE